MIAWWMAYAVAVGCPVLLAAAIVARSMRHHGRAERGVWLAAIGLAILLPAVAGIRRSAEGPTTDGALAAHTTERALSGDAVPASSIPIGLPGVVALPPSVPVAPYPLGLDAFLIGLWTLASLTLVVRWVVALHRLESLRATWPSGSLDGIPVLISQEFGPAVAGLVRPRIVVPWWLSSLPGPQRALVLLHETEHVARGIPS